MQFKSAHLGGVNDDYTTYAGEVILDFIEPWAIADSTNGYNNVFFYKVPE